MSLHIDERDDGGFALFLNGDCQFDTEDEALYHESMALPALSLTAPTHPGRTRVLICGGGDGLALRECLRFPGVAHVDLVDYDAEILALGRSRFADLNRHAFEDSRVKVHIADAWEFLTDVTPYDVVLCDFTVPRRPEDTRVFTAEWYRRVATALAPDGTAAINALSPQVTPEAFWCLRRTVRAAGLSALPYRVCIPSFRARGYGVWAFMLAAHRPLRRADLRSLTCPSPTRQADLRRLWRGARFAKPERALERRVPIHTLANGCLLPLLLNPGRTDLSDVPAPDAGAPFDLGPLLRAIPILHPYHTRLMIETLAAEVVGSVRALDVRRLVDALLRRAGELPGGLLRELERLRDFLLARVFDLASLGAWGYRLFATLVILFTLANAIAPDNAFAKGTAGIGHSGISRGYGGSFGGERGFGGATGTRSGSSFGGERGFGGSSGRTAPRSSFGGERGFGGGWNAEPAPHMTGTGFRHSYGQGEPTDINGNTYPVRSFRYHYWGGGLHAFPYTGQPGGTPANTPPPEEHQALFVADDDMMVLDNGDVVVTLSDSAYLLVKNGTVTLMSRQAAEPLAALYPNPEMFNNIGGELQGQQPLVQQGILAREDWLSWVGWTSALFPNVRDDRSELSHLQDLSRRLDTALAHLGNPPGTIPAPLTPPANSVELFVGAYAQPDGTVALLGPDDRWSVTNGQQMAIGSLTLPATMDHTCPPELAAALKSVMVKLQKEFTADLASADNDLNDIATERASLNKDLTDYQTLFAQNGNDPNYEVDYGTDSIPVSEALTRTQNDLDANQRNHDQVAADRAKTAADLERLNQALPRFGR